MFPLSEAGRMKVAHRLFYECSNQAGKVRNRDAQNEADVRDVTTDTVVRGCVMFG
jgi:hypothetical protein